MKSRSLVHSIGYAWEGLRFAFQTQRNIRIHSIFAVAVFLVACGLGFSTRELALLVLTIFQVIGFELLNTALEVTVDLCTSEYNYLACKAKNVAAGAVLVSAFMAVLIGLLLFGPHMVRMWVLLGR